MQSIKQLLFIDDTLSNKISYYHLLALLISLPLDQFYSHLILISFAMHTFLHVKKGNFKAVFTKQVLILQSVFFVSLISIIYSSNRNEGFAEVGRQAVIVLMPVLFSLTSLDIKKYRERLLLGFAMGVTLAVIYLYYDAGRIIRFYGYPLKTLFAPAFTNHNFSDGIGMHATFLSLQVGLALVYLLSVLFKRGSVLERIIYAFCSMILVAAIIQLGAKSVFIALLIVLNIGVPLFIPEEKSRWKFVAALVLITLVLAGVILHSDNFRRRYVTDLATDLSQASGHETTDPRLARWEVAIQLIEKSPIVGYGTGSEIGLLKEGYFSKKLYNSYLNNLNAHNEYLSLLIKSGIIGLLIYLLILVYGFRACIRKRDIVLLTFLLFITVTSLSENLLDVDKGTLFYGFFFSFFILSDTPKQTINN